MDTPDNYYAILGVPIDVDNDTLKRVYRQLARRYHPDLAGPEGAVQMKRINRAYDVLSNPQKRLDYDTIIGGVIDLRQNGLTRPRRVQRKFDAADELDFSSLSIFSTKGPLHPGPVQHTFLGVISAVSSIRTAHGWRIAAGSLDGKGLLWQPGQEESSELQYFTSDPMLTVESLRELRFSAQGGLLAGWGRLGLHVWHTSNGNLLWSYSLLQRAVSAHYSLDVILHEQSDANHTVRMALPLLAIQGPSPRSKGVRGTDIVQHQLGAPAGSLSEPLVCAEDEIEKRQFWAIRLRNLAQDGNELLTLSCAHVPGEQAETAIIRSWDLNTKARFSNKLRPRISASILAGLCAHCVPPYAVTPDNHWLAFVYMGNKIRLYDTLNGTFNELESGGMGGSSRLAISPDGQWIAIAREDSEVNEGVIDLWSLSEGRIIQKLYHPWQISAMQFAEKQLLVALTDGTLQVWQ